MSETFLPPNYVIPSAPSNYFKFVDGLNQFRALTSAIVGYEYFNTDNKPVRSHEAFPTTPTDIKKDGKVKPFWAFFVWNYQVKAVQVLEITQKTIMVAINALVTNPKWGNPKMYDIAITKSGDGLETEYNVQGEPPISELSPEILNEFMKLNTNLEALFTGGDPFQAKSTDPVYVPSSIDEVLPDESPAAKAMREGKEAVSKK